METLGHPKIRIVLKISKKNVKQKKKEAPSTATYRRYQS